MPTPPLTNSERLSALNTYIDGKIKRYNLMFAVNGGAFALGKLLKTSGTQDFLGRLTVTHLAIGSIAFSFLMWFDVWLWGQNMSHNYFEHTKEKVFQWRGKAILSLLSSLLILGWLMAVWSWWTTITTFVLLSIAGALLVYHHAKSQKSRRVPRSVV